MKTPVEMMEIIDNSASNTKCIPSEYVEWRKWKSVLNARFSIPSTFRITENHVFCFNRDNPGVLFARQFSTSSTEHTFTCSKSGNSVYAASKIIKKTLSTEDAKTSWPPLHEIKIGKRENKTRVSNKENSGQILHF